jgi:hypothetical protein
MTNSAARLADFKCSLRAWHRRPQRIQVYRLGKNVDRRVYRLPDGEELVGKEMTLELEELNGQRNLKYRFIPTAEALNTAKSATTPNTANSESAAPEHARPTESDKPPLASVRS